VYKLWRNHFDDQNWEFLIYSLGTWLAPYRFKHVAFLIGPTDSGKSTFIENLIRPIRPIVATVSLKSITDYQFGLEDLLGKQINVYCEKGETVLKNIDLINNLIGAHDYIIVHRKHKPSSVMRSLKTMFFAMTDPPIIYEYGGETLWAFVNRLSIIHMHKPEGFKPENEVYANPKEVFKFLLACRVKLEQNNWEIKKLSNEEILEYLMKASNSALRFLEESGYVEPDPMSSVKGTELYEVYVRWCNEVGIRPMGLNQFYTTVATKYYKYQREGTAWFKGLRIKYTKLTEDKTLFNWS
jgi:Predicted ATPase